MPVRKATFPLFLSLSPRFGNSWSSGCPLTPMCPSFRLGPWQCPTFWTLRKGCWSPWLEPCLLRSFICLFCTKTVTRTERAFGLTGLDSLEHFLKCLALNDVARLPSVDLRLGRLTMPSRAASLHSAFYKEGETTPSCLVAFSLGLRMKSFTAYN